jgi:hypothetical protein
VRRCGRESVLQANSGTIATETCANRADQIDRQRVKRPGRSGSWPHSFGGERLSGICRSATGRMGDEDSALVEKNTPETSCESQRRVPQHDHRNPSGTQQATSQKSEDARRNRTKTRTPLNVKRLLSAACRRRRRRNLHRLGLSPHDLGS